MLQNCTNTSSKISGIGKTRSYSLHREGGSLVLSWAGDAHDLPSWCIIPAKEAKRFLRGEEGLRAVTARAWARTAGLSL